MIDPSIPSPHADSAASAASAVARLTRWVDDFPAPGVRFADLSPVFADAVGLRSLVSAIAAQSGEVDLVAGIDARGFLLGAAVALELGAGVLPVRKAGKLPPPVHSQSYQLEYARATLEVPAAGVDLQGRRVLVVDDVLATGGTLEAAARLLQRSGVQIVGAAVVLEIGALGGRARWPGESLTALARA